MAARGADERAAVLFSYCQVCKYRRFRTRLGKIRTNNMRVGRDGRVVFYDVVSSAECVQRMLIINDGINNFTTAPRKITESATRELGERVENKIYTYV